MIGHDRIAAHAAATGGAATGTDADTGTVAGAARFLLALFQQADNLRAKFPGLLGAVPRFLSRWLCSTSISTFCVST